MNKAFFALFLMALFFSGTAFAQEFRPATVKSMDVTISIEATGSFWGTVSEGDELEVLFLSMQEDDAQNILSAEEFLEIGGKKILPEYVERDGLKYASYKIKNLYAFASTPQFRVVRDVRVERGALIGLGNDYSLSDGIDGFEEFKKQSDYIEVNDQELRSKAALEFGSDSEIETIREIAEWVNSNIEYDFENYYNGVFSAKQTYNSRAGVCDEFANLSAAFLRIKGIPTKYVKGVSFDGQRFGLHGWLEVFLPGTGWIGVDSTYGEAGYLDAAHFTVAKTADANLATDLITLSKSRNPIQVSLSIGLPEVEINSVEFFSGLLETSISKPAQVQAGKLFDINASIKNVSGENAVFPVELLLHSDFRAEQPSKLVHFSAGETKTVSWKVRAPEKDFDSGFYTYGMLLLLPDGNVEASVKVVPEKFAKKNSSISVKDVSPFISGQSLEIRVELENSGGKNGGALIEAFSGETVLLSEKAVVEALSSKIVSVSVKNVRPGKILLKVSAEEEKTFEIIVPEKIEEEEIEAVEVPSSDEGNGLKGLREGVADAGWFTERELLLVLAVGGTVVFVGLLTMLLLKLK